LESSFKNKILLITGGTGSFGNTVLRRFLNTGLKEVRIFSRDEKKQEDMRINLSNDRVKFYIGDVRDQASVDNVCNGVDYIFHAAALKQVPSCEFYPMEAVKTNILGTDNVLNSAIKNNVKRVILLSTDKAVYPINAMGISKSMAEKVLIAKSRSLTSNQTILSSTRYGNVMASRGSVIPLFINQIKNKQSITITDPKMTRFLMSLEESVDLVIYAFNNSQQGDLFVQKAPATTVLNIAEALKQIFQSNSPIKIIGTRHGEKLYESLISREEMLKAIDKDNYYIIPVDNRDLNYNKYFIDGEEKLSNLDDYTSHNTNQLNLNEVIEKLLTLDYVKAELNA
jgi:UDP-glucose 4-epimerase